MSTPLDYDQEHQAFISLLAFVTRATLSTNHGDDFSDPFLSGPISWNWTGSVDAAALSYERASTGDLARLQIADDETRTMSASAYGGFSPSTSDFSPTTPDFPPIFSPTTPASGTSPTTPYSPNTPFFTYSEFQPLPIPLTLFIGNGDEGQLSGDINQHRSTNENEYVSITSAPTIINTEAPQGSRTDSAVDTQVLPGQEKANIPPKSFVCRICGKDLTAGHNLKFHIWSHLGVKPFHCPEPDCPTSYKATVPWTLKRHVLNVHRKILVEWPQADFSDYSKWPWLNSSLSTLNDMAVKVWPQTGSNDTKPENVFHIFASIYAFAFLLSFFCFRFFAFVFLLSLTRILQKKFHQFSTKINSSH
ncbi:hypothetical protein K435DRAFT_471524 [Dendrothele bispora CBS 962.96]|uniref:C2H2-type domain-containing protein n=1 Tax=Dendrothele bispora (strain CBS 962.96) TaxID=1314807 RepID=A0A4S8KZQ6_DENBC|nr:hypothetical protein K435DRAFT_471524 [Dendrothele bispora CBS 962.96]